MPEQRLTSTGSSADPQGLAASTDRKRPKIVGFICDYAVATPGIVGEGGAMRDVPNVTLIQVPCSGFIRPAWLEFALRNGAEGAFVCGCPLGDCFNRLGNNLIGDRVAQMRRRLERQKIHPDRVATLYYGLHDQVEFIAAVRTFSDRVAGLPGPVVPPARTSPKPAPAGAPPRAGGAPAAGGAPKQEEG
jgi:F420-non-reducing hydrogenase iron-sulfur subunit